jgi:hypothetical protein
MVYNEEVLIRQYPIVFRFVQNLAYDRGIRAV